MNGKTRMSRYQKKSPKKSTPPKKGGSSTKKVTKTQTKKNKQPKKQANPKKVKIRYKRVLVAVLIFLFLGAGVYYFCSLPITNFYISGNTYYKDQEILELANLSNYPPNISVFRKKVEQLLEKEELILNAKVKKLGRTVKITIEENYPLFFYDNRKRTVLFDGSETQNVYSAPILINYVPDTIYEGFLNHMKEVDRGILERISEIKYDPDEVDKERFLLSMRDGNYVYLTLSKFDAINSYVNIIREFPNQKGILYLNAGNSFEVLEK